jgi:hypothetical protein
MIIEDDTQQHSQKKTYGICQRKAKALPNKINIGLSEHKAAHLPELYEHTHHVCAPTATRNV